MTPEASEQQALFDMIFRYQDRFPALRLVFHIPNGGKALMARQGAWWKEQGVRAGVPDVFCAVADVDHSSCSARTIPGLWVEMKVKPNKVSKEQAEMMNALREQGYRVEVCWSWGEAWNVIVGYLGMPQELKQN